MSNISSTDIPRRILSYLAKKIKMGTLSPCDKMRIIKNKISRYPDFPKPGIEFIDIFSVLRDPPTFQMLNDVILDHVQTINPKVEAVAGLDARGFLFGPIIALNNEIPFIPIRKKGKLPGETHAVTYQLEYGEDTLEVQETELKKGTNVLLIDDLIATGGSLIAGCSLLKKVGFNVVECLVIINLKDLNGACKLTTPFHSLLDF